MKDKTQFVILKLGEGCQNLRRVMGKKCTIMKQRQMDQNPAEPAKKKLVQREFNNLQSIGFLLWPTAPYMLHVLFFPFLLTPPLLNPISSIGSFLLIIGLFPSFFLFDDTI